MFFTSYIFFIKILWNGFCFVSCVFLTSSHAITELFIILAKYFSFSQIYLLGFQTYSFLHTWNFYTYFNIYCYSTIIWITFFSIKFTFTSAWYILCYLSYPILCHIFDSFISVIMLNTFWFKFSVLFGVHTVLHKSLGALQFQTHLSNLIQKG